MRSGFAAQPGGEPNEFVRHLVYPLFQVGIDQLITLESIASGVNESRNDDRAKIEHQAVGVSHDRHVAAHAARGAEETNDLVFPGFSAQLDHVLGRGGDVVIVNWSRDEDSVSRMDRLVQFLRSGYAIAGVGVAER